ncbi:vascular cell adhesion protein 1 [Callorhinchus milii]|uniref:vascular cell adhesion protein 1 n=1 Tax=Callorhinchus milii TaxID=7868 RepID=UPI001C3FE0A5|nr:vascular cell adhesion protein 1 [Callorhinchus milii]
MPSTGCGLAVSLLLSLCTAGATFELEVRPGREVWAREGQQVTLSCRISGCLEPSPRLFWSKSGDSVVGGKQTSDESNYHLTFDAVTLKNQNGYYCKAACGDVYEERRISLYIYYLPRTLRLEPSGPVWAGEQVSLICHVDMVYPIEDLKVEYFKGTELLETISSDRLSLPESSQSINHQLTPAMEDHGKNLSCVAYLKIGKEVESAQGSFILGVHYGPLNITLNRAAISTATKGQDITVTCSTQSNPPANISWSKLWPEGWLPVSAQEATLKLYDVGFSDSGTYRCEASNGPRKETKELQIQIEGAPSGTRLSITPSVAKQGENVTIACTTSSYPLAQFVLRQSGSSLPKLPSSDGTFTITSVQSANAGQYECEATNSLGKDTASEKLSVQVPPQNLLVVVSPSSTFREGYNLTFNCTADSSSPTHYTWTKLGNESMLSLSNSFTLWNARAYHAGVYQVEVRNELGSMTGTVEIIIKGERTDEGPELGSLGTYLMVGGMALAGGGLVTGLWWFRKKMLADSFSPVSGQIP